MTAKPSLASVFEDHLCLQLTIGTPGVRKKVSTTQVEVDADKKMIHVSKDIIDCQEYKRVVSMNGEIKGYLQRVALPSMLRAGLYLVPVDLVQPVVAQLDDYIKQREKLIEEFLAVYEKAKGEAKKRLKELYDLTDYPARQALRMSFYVDYQLTAESVPKKLQDISKKLFESERLKIVNKWEEAGEQIRSVLRSSMADLVSHLAERLTGASEEGKPKIFRDTAVKNIEEFLESFDPRNVTKDQELKTLVDRCRKVLHGVDVKQLRDEESEERKRVAGEMGKVKAALDKLVVEKPSRRLKFEGGA